jgi:hypothetical protein
MTDRVRKFDFAPITDFCAKWLPDLPAQRLEELKEDMVEALILHTDPIPGSDAEVRAAAVKLMQEFVEGLEPGANLNRDMLMDAGGLPKDNGSDGRFTTRWAKENSALLHNPSRTSHFVKRLPNANGNGSGI